MNSYVMGYEPYRGDIKSRVTGLLVSDRQGESVIYGLFHSEPRGTLFIEAGVPVYEGMIIGENNREQDLDVNACKGKEALQHARLRQGRILESHAGPSDDLGARHRVHSRRRTRWK
jgi:predicted membrane GTPase involved in stress response